MSETRRGRPRVYCSRACRDAGWTGHRAADRTQVDPAAVWRLVHGHPVTSTRAERVAATAQLAERGLTLTQVATLLRVTSRSVSRYRAETANQRKVA